MKPAIAQQRVLLEAATPGVEIAEGRLHTPDPCRGNLLERGLRASYERSPPEPARTTQSIPAISSSLYLLSTDIIDMVRESQIENMACDRVETHLDDEHHSAPVHHTHGRHMTCHLLSRLSFGPDHCHISFHLWGLHIVPINDPMFQIDIRPAASKTELTPVRGDCSNTAHHISTGARIGFGKANHQKAVIPAVVAHDQARGFQTI